MDRYQKVEQKKQDIPISENEIRITSQGLVRNYISYATSLLQERRGKEIVLKAMGQAISKTVAIAEIIKRRIPQLHQDTAISSVSITDVWEPIEEGLVPVEMTRHVSMISITLSLKELNKTSPGYQPPNYVDRQRPQYNNYQRQYQPRQARPAYNAVNQDGFEPNGENYEGGRDQGRGGGRGGRGRGWNRGGYANYQRGGGYGNNQRGGYGNYQGNGYGNQQGGEYGNQQGRGYGNQQGDEYGNQRGRGYVNRRGGGYGNQQGDGYGNQQGDEYGNQRGRGYVNRRGGGYGNQQGDGYGNYQENNGYSNYGRGGGRGGNSGNRGTGYGRGGRSVGGGGRGYSPGRGRMDNRPRDGDQQQE